MNVCKASGVFFLFFQSADKTYGRSIEGVVSDYTKNLISAVESLHEVYYSELSFSMSNFHFAQGMKIYVFMNTLLSLSYDLPL